MNNFLPSNKLKDAIKKVYEIAKEDLMLMISQKMKTFR
jgi:hypothetical protein